jgi:hypothetical protein
MTATVSVGSPVWGADLLPTLSLTTHAEGVGLLSDELIDLLGRLLAGPQSPPPERHVEHLLRELRSDPALHRPLNLRAHMQHAMKNETHMTVSGHSLQSNHQEASKHT